MVKTRKKIEIRGMVQGVGFRPFIHKLIADCDLTGWIRNTGFGVEMEIEGDDAGVASFIGRLGNEKPPLAFIERIDVTEQNEPGNYTTFEILTSEDGTTDTLISPDVCTCEDCLKELFLRADRRHLYPFINCTNCGPRFTITRSIPYDRANTTMAGFRMCDKCSDEYGDITNRRYHAQPDCCPDCGPALRFLTAGEAAQGSTDGETDDPVGTAKRYLAEGRIIAIKGLGGFHIACRADDDALVDRLRALKERDEKPFAIMFAGMDEVRKYCEADEEEITLLESQVRPIVLLRKKDKNAFASVSENDRIGAMLPYTPVHFLLFSDEDGNADSSVPQMLVMTSANLSDRPIISDNDEAVRELSGIVDGFLLHDRDIAVKCDDSVMWARNGGYFARRSRGFVPLPLILEKEVSEHILACGAEQKATFAVTKGNHVFMSQHIGDLKNIESYTNYSFQIEHFENLFEIQPAVIACDLHPDYLSTAYAEERSGITGARLVKVQHHHAHMASCMADNGLNERVIGVVWDGTGIGTDGKAWGGEFLVGDYGSFERKGTIRPVRLPGGDIAAREVWRTAESLIIDALGTEAEKQASYCGNGSGMRERRAAAAAMLESGVNCPEVTGMGRLFDGVSSLLGIKDVSSYEGQAAILLEAAADGNENGTYPYDVYTENGMYVFDFRPMVQEIVSETQRAKGAAKFMNTLVEMAADICGRISKDTGIEKVVLSGGTFQNIYILDRLIPRLERDGLSVYTHSRVSTNDEGISLGQTMIAARTIDPQ